MPIRPETVRRKQLFRQYEAALRKPHAHKHIRQELRSLGVSLEEIDAFRVSVRRMIRSERNTR